MIKYITTDEEVVQVIEDILTFEGEFIPLDTETTSLDTQTAKLLLFQFKLDDDIYVINSITVSLVDRIVDAIIQNGATCIAHNAKYDAKIIMSNLGREIKHWQDTMYLEVAIHAGVGKMYYSLNELVELYLGRKLDKEVRLGFIEKIDGDFTQEEIDYSANDVDVLLPIYLKQMEILEEAGMTEIATIEGRLSPVIASMEQNGITLNVDAWLSILEKAKIDMKQKYELVMNTLMGYIDFTKFKNAYQAYEFLAIRVTTKKKRSLLEKIQNFFEIQDYVVNDFNMNSNNQLKSLLSYIYDEDLSSVGKKALNDLASRTKENTEPLNQLLDYRQASKKVSTYGTKFLGHIHPVTGRVHSSYSNIGTATGRMSCVPLDSEILTKRGWLTYDQLSIGEDVIGFDILTETYKWTELKKIHLYEKGEVGRLKVNKGHDSRYLFGPYSTGNHKWVVKGDLQEVIGLAKSETLPRRFDVVFSNGEKLPSPSESIISPDDAFLWGWYLTDGSLVRTSSGNIALEIQVVKERSKLQLRERFSKHKSWVIGNELKYTTFGNKGIADGTRQRFYVGTEYFTPLYEKIMSMSPSELVVNMSEDARNSFLAAMLEGDGSIRKGATRYDRFGAVVDDVKHTTDYFETVCKFLGKHIIPRRRILISGKTFIDYQITVDPFFTRDKHYRWKPEKEVPVWCPETGTGTWVMRQDHQMYITGNSSKPNLQNIPRGEEYRHAFTARDGFKIIGIDYSQQEYRLAGSLSGEDQIINAYLNGIDMHTKTGAILYGKETDNVTKEERSFGKTINFAILYGTSAWGMANNLKMPESKAKEIMDIFFSGYPKLSAFIGQAKEMILERGFSVTALGRRRYNKESPLFGTPYQKKLFSSRVTREGFNHIIQGTAADITKLAMINIYENNPFGKDLKVLMQIHDEVICEAREEVAQEAYDYVQREMIAAEQPFLGRIPAVADGYISNTWEKA